MVVEIHGAASELDILCGDRLLCVDNQPVQNEEQARRVWDHAPEAQNVRLIFEAGPDRLARMVRHNTTDADHHSSGAPGEPGDDVER